MILVECLIHLLNFWRVPKISKTIEIKFILVAVSNKFRHSYRSSSSIGLLFMMLKFIWKRLEVIKKNFEINNILLFRNSQARIKIFIAVFYYLYPTNAAWQWSTKYCFRNYSLHMLSQKTAWENVLGDHRDESWFHRNEGLAFTDRSTECRGWLGVL